MENKKYEILEDDFILHEGIKLYRIRSLIDISLMHYFDIAKGELGGYVEGYHNLSQEGTCWIYVNAKVFGNARVIEDAIVGDYAKVYGNAVIGYNAAVRGFAKVFGNAKIESARVVGKAEVYGNSIVKGTAIVKGDSIISDNAAVVNVKTSYSIFDELNCCVEDSYICDNAEFRIREQSKMTLHDKLSNNSIIYL